jgi:hypothetical protein
MVVRNQFMLGLAVGVISVLGCATKFPYRPYGLDVELVDTRDGKLLGPAAKDDLPLDTCKATDGRKTPCIVLMEDDFYAWKKERVEMLERLKACETQK